jgi:hypothetical protein
VISTATISLVHHIIKAGIPGTRGLSFPLRITIWVAEPAAWARHLRLPANAVTGQGLGEESAANEAGNPVLYAVQSAEGRVLYLITRERWAILNL